MSLTYLLHIFRSKVTLIVLLCAFFFVPLFDTQAQSAIYFLDENPGAYAAYSLRQLTAGYSGPVLRVRRSSDNAEQDIFFGSDGWINTAALSSFVGSGNGYVTTWYDQTGGEAMTNSNTGRQPLLVENGVVMTRNGVPVLRFLDNEVTPSGQAMSLSTVDRPTAINSTDYRLAMVVERTETTGGERNYAGVDRRSRPHEGVWYRGNQSYPNGGSNIRIHGQTEELFRSIVMRNNGSVAELWQGRNLQRTISSADNVNVATVRDDLDQVHVGGTPAIDSNGFNGYLGEFIVFSSFGASDFPEEYNTSVANAWGAGPAEINEGAIIPQKYGYQVTLYDWLETISVSDVTLPAMTFRWDGTVGDIDELADLWLEVEPMTTSRVVRGEPQWYVLDAGDGRGIEATGEIRVWHGPGRDGYGGNPPRSWSNEPAHLYQLSLPYNGGEGNPYYRNRAMGLRALVVAMVDMMVYHNELDTNSSIGTWQDMYGKAFLGWAETYRWTKDMLPADVQDAFEEGMGYFLDQMIELGPRAVNTNMDMFSMHGAVDFYMSTDDPVLRAKAVAAVKRALFGYTDGVLETRHDVFKIGPDKGVFDPSGFIMEGGQPDLFYGGESTYHLIGAIAAATNRDTGAIEPDWAFLTEVVRRMEEWRAYQYFYEPATRNAGASESNPGRTYHGGAGYSGRTGAGVPAGQAGDIWKYITLADLIDGAEHRIFSRWNRSQLPDRDDMERDITNMLAERTTEIAQVHTGSPGVWSGWSPWTKKTPYMPPKGWYTRLNSLVSSNSASLNPPVAQVGNYYNKTFGGLPTGDQYWAYKNTDGSNEWGFFLEAQAKQGTYGGWYGGKIETFWTDKTGVVLINRHGKTGCDAADREDSRCYDNMDVKAGHHVWGRDENGRGFTTLLLKGRELDRPVIFDTNASNPNVSITNKFNNIAWADNLTSSNNGEETGNELTGRFDVENTFTALSNGVEVTHTISSDGSDQLTELWASIPVFLRTNNPIRPGGDNQAGLSDTTIEYWEGSAWVALPEDTNGDGFPEMVNTTQLRLGRDFLLGDGPQYVYVSFASSQRLRLSESVYLDPYQTNTSARTVHFDLHGNPGAVQQAPANRSITYSITTEPTPGGGVIGTPTNESPIVGITVPAGTYVDPATVNLSATANDPDGTVSMVEFLVDGNVVETDTSSPYEYSWDGVVEGTYVVTARATDNEGAQSTTAGINVVVNPTTPSQDPVVILSVPRSSYETPATINLSATASDADGTVARVQFYRDGTLLGEDTTSPYTYSETVTTAGTYDYTARATDNEGNTAETGDVRVIISVPNTNPTIILTSPFEGANYTAPASVPLEVTVNDPDGDAITMVEFFHGNTKLAEDTEAPYLFTWADAPEGSYALTARVTDVRGGTGTSNTRNIIVNAGTGGGGGPDSDGDGVPNNLDRCPNTPSNIRAHVNRRGCPRPVATKFDILTDFNSANLTDLDLFELGITNQAKVTFSNRSLRLLRNNAGVSERMDLDAAFDVAKHRFTLNSSLLPALNRPATLTFYDVQFNNPRVLRDGITCTSCTTSLNGSTLTVEVDGFSTYEVVEGESEEEPEATPESSGGTSSSGGGGGGGSTSSGGSSSGGSSGGGGSSSAPAISGGTADSNGNVEPAVGSTQETQMESTTSNPVVGVPELLGPPLVQSTCDFGRNLTLGSKGTDVTCLQEWLTDLGHYTYGKTTGYFGNVTKEAVASWQRSVGLTAQGFFGPQSRAKYAESGSTVSVGETSEQAALIAQIQQLLTLIATLQAQLNGTTPVVVTNALFTRALTKRK